MIALPISTSKTTVKNGIMAFEKILQEGQPIEAKLWRKLEDKLSHAMYSTYKDMEKEVNPDREHKPEIWNMKPEEREAWKKTPEGIAYEKSVDRYFEISKVFLASFPYKLEQLSKIISEREQNANKFTGEAKEIDEKIITMLKTWLPVAELVAEAKKLVIEKVTKKQQQERQQKLFLKPIQTRDLLTKVRALLEQNIESEFKNLVASMEDAYILAMERIKEAVAKHEKFLKDNPNMGTHNKSWFSFKKKELGNFDSYLSQKIVVPSYDSTMREEQQMKPDAEEICKKEALAEATGMKENYIIKNMQKMSAVVGEKDKKSVGITNSSAKGSFNHTTFEGWIHLEFSDGTKFSVKNQMVWAMSHLGKTFNRFPTTFHNVTFIDGKTQAMVPEKEMVEVWSKQ